MSALTKLFVVLLVVISLMQTAASVVFVARVDDLQSGMEAAELKVRQQEDRANAAERAAAAANAANLASAQQFNSQVQAMQSELTATKQQVVDRDVQLADASTKMSLQSADLGRLTEALRASESTKSNLQQQVAELRQVSDKLTTQTAQLNSSVSDLTNRLEVTERQRRELAEQYARARTDLDKAMKAGFRPDDTARAIVSPPPINAVVRDIRAIAGVPYATISVGSADDVEHGMQFNLVDRNTGSFLGTLTVDTVEPNEASGRLAGPRVAEVRPGTEARTQL